ncbi:NAD(P)/FAD-dependent oxidoreductase [Streptomyces cinerochromogenes]|uniref:NAD(P)/FAD-dependent oxidoreductase n=1 Tax=Streptomyces cinerochromogenes TaxID=66422 RepID=A0ABW7BI67_9ACTN
MSSEPYDVVVAGAGPAGLLTAALVAGRGHRVLLLERDPCPGGLPGGVVRERSTAVNVVIEDERVTGLRHLPQGEPARTVRARCVVDASGGDSPLRRHVAGARGSSGLAVYACFTADTGRAEGPRRFPFGNGWFWTAPAGDGLTQVGAVVRPDLADRVRADPEGALSGFAEACPPVRDLLAGAVRAAGGPGRIRVRPHWSYADHRLWRPGMLLVGDAACAVGAQPLPVLGTHLACRGAGLAARALDGFLRGTADEAEAFAEFEHRYREAYDSVLHDGIPQDGGPHDGILPGEGLHPEGTFPPPPVPFAGAARAGVSR